MIMTGDPELINLYKVIKKSLHTGRIQYKKNPAKIQMLLHDEKIGVWDGMSRRHIVRPIFFSETLNSQWYTVVYSFIVQLKDEIDKAYFQQDGATAHTSMAVLDDTFAKRIISKTTWPPRSPDLSLPDFLLWGVTKNSAYSNNPHTTDELKMTNTEHIRNVDRAILNTVRRVNKCLENCRGTL